MTAATLTLTDFLLARVAEDEAVAYLDEDPPSRHSDDSWNLLPDSIDQPVEFGTGYGPTMHVTMTIARFRAECEAKRRIVEAFEAERVRRDIYNRDYDSGEYDFNNNDLRARLASNAECRGLEIAMLTLAAVYADHPDYNEAWRP